MGLVIKSAKTKFHLGTRRVVVVVMLAAHRNW